MAVNPWSPEEHAFVVAHWNAGRTARQIEVMMRGEFDTERSFRSITGRLSREGLWRDPEKNRENIRRVSSERRAEIISRYEAGEQIKVIAESFGCSSSAILQRIKDWGRYVPRMNPSRHREPQFIELWNAGTTAAEIGRQMGATLKMVERWAVLGRHDGTIQPKSKIMPKWPDADVALLKKLWSEGVGPRDISAQTGWSLNRIGGQKRKLGLPSQRYPSERKTAKGRDYAHLRAVASEAARIAAERKAEAKRLREEQAESMWQHTLTSRPFLTREAGECCWPLGERGDFHACCDPVAAGDAYCAEHRLIAGGRRVPMKERLSPVSAPSNTRGRPSIFDACRMAA